MDKKFLISDGVNGFDGVDIPLAPEYIQSGGTDAYLKTTNTASISPAVKEKIEGTINLHKVAKTGAYGDLNDLPDIPAVQIQSDWTQTNTSAKDFIKNKPTIPAEQIQSDWNQTGTSAKDYIKNKPAIPSALTEITEAEIIAGSSAVLRAMSGRRSQAILNKAFPVGSVYVTSTNSAPTVGGTWTLFDKEFDGTTITGGFVINTTGTTSVDAYITRNGHALTLQLNIVNKVAYTDSTVTIGSWNLTTIGVSSLGFTCRSVGFSDAGNGVIMFNTQTNGDMTSVDVIGKTSSAEIAVGSTSYSFVTYSIPYTNMLDAACNKFFWRRTN